MKSITFEKIAGIAILITGIGHTTAHFLLEVLPNPHLELRSAMANSILKIGSEVSVLDFHNGFSLNMGILLLGFGIHILRNKDKTGLLINTILSALLVVVSVCYFPIFVVVLTSISFVSLLLKLLNYDH